MISEISNKINGKLIRFPPVDRDGLNLTVESKGYRAINIFTNRRGRHNPPDTIFEIYNLITPRSTSSWFGRGFNPLKWDIENDLDG